MSEAASSGRIFVNTAEAADFVGDPVTVAQENQSARVSNTSEDQNSATSGHLLLGETTGASVPT